MIVPNAANQCSSCLAQTIDLKAMLQNSDKGDPLIIHQCRQCRRFARNDTNFEYCEPESPQLLSICLKHIPILTKKGHAANKLHITDSSFIWQEPHSMRLKIAVTVRTEVEHVTIQQRVPVVFQIQWKMCAQCNREFTNRQWHALVQLRQKRENGSPRKGLATLELALGRHKEIRRHVLKIDASRQGLDFYFLTLSQAQHFAQFLQRLAPMRIKTSSKLVSTDSKNNTANMKHTLTCDMVPLCRDDLVLVHKESRSKLGGRLALVSKVASVIHLMDASPKRFGMLDHVEVTAEGYHKSGGAAYTVLQTSERMIRFVVLDVELCHDSHQDEDSLYQGPSSGVEKYALADVQVARESDLGNNDEVLSCVTHLGHLVQPGDVVWGYDLISTAASLNATVTKASSASSSFMGAASVVGLEEVINSNVVLQDVVLVKKISAKEQREMAEAADAANASDMSGGPINGDDAGEAADGIRGKKKGPHISKKKLRRQQKRDKKQRELEESAARMGFLEDLEEAQSPYLMGDEDEDDSSGDFAQQWQNDPELAAELRAVERELAEAFPEGIKADNEEKTLEAEQENPKAPTDNDDEEEIQAR
jgi:nonsense-mediated mRNA decay protein 3